MLFTVQCLFYQEELSFVGSNWMPVITGRYQIFPVTGSEIMEEEQEE